MRQMKHDDAYASAPNRHLGRRQAAQKELKLYPELARRPLKTEDRGAYHRLLTQHPAAVVRSHFQKWAQ
jgi:hypothetical protein